DFLANYRCIVPDHFNYARDVIDAYAADEPGRRALVWCDDHGRERIFSFGDLSRLSNQAANAFRALGIGRGDKVLLLLKRRYEYWISVLALCKLGAVAIPATHLLTAKDVVYRCNAADVKAIIAVAYPEVYPHVEQAVPECATLEHLICVDGTLPGWLSFDKLMEAQPQELSFPIENDNSDAMLIYFTSGTTGMPKMVLHDYTYPLGHLPTGVYWHALDETDLHITVADTGWAKCSWGKIYGQWLAGAALFVYDMDKFVPSKLLEKLAQYHVTSLCAPPTIYRFIIKEDLSAYDLSALKKGCTAGEPLNPSVFDDFYRATGVKLREGFGQSESGVICGTWRGLPERVGSIGIPNPQYDVVLLAPDGTPCEIGEEGEIVIRCKKDEPHPLGLLREYYRDPLRTDSAFFDGAYHTGDIAWQDEDGYFWFVGRSDDIIKSSGYRIGPFEVESALLTHPAVVECAITGVPHPDRGQVVKATVVLSRGYSPSDELVKELQNHVKRTTAPYKYPRIVEFVDELPKTFSGKIRRKHIRDTDSQGKT
nr:AMP-binding protein [bacterium]